jgi:hypothetical protein
MVIIKFDHVQKCSTTLYEGEMLDCLKEYEKLTQEFEKSGQFMVNEIEIDPNQITFVREFATLDGGHVFDLIICGGAVKSITISK